MKSINLTSPIIFFLGVVVASNSAHGQQLVRIARIQIDSAQVWSYNNFLKEEISASIEKEPGVRTLYAVAERAHQTNVTIFETYADTSAYRKHLQTSHFKKYKSGTTRMVQALRLIEMNPIFYGRKPAGATSDSFVRVIQLEIDPSQLENYAAALKKVLDTSIRQEPGVMVMFGVSEKLNSNHVTILEIYRDAQAAQKHLETPHYLQYKSDSKDVVRSRQVIDAMSIALGAQNSRH